MNELHVARLKKYLGGLLLAALLLVYVGLQGCRYNLPPTAIQTPDSTANPATAETNCSGAAPNPTETASRTGQIPAGTAYDPVWGDFPPPSLDPATAIPPPLSGLSLPDEVLVWILLGSDTEPPFTGRTPAIHLVFVHPRFSKASLVSIPGDLYVYIPGYTMQRLSTAYTLGGMQTLRQTLAYNFGVSPSRFVLAHPGDFQWLVDDLNQIEVTVFFPMPQACGGIPAGRIVMDGALALCYVSHRDNLDEIDRMRRQQQLLRLLFLKLARDGNLASLPSLYRSYEGWVRTDFSLMELTGYIPLALRLADPDRISYYMIGWDQFTIWEIPGKSQARVFLPDRSGVRDIMEQAIQAVLTPAPLTDRVQTLEAQLTAVALGTPTPTITPSSSQTPTPTITGTPELTQQTTTTITTTTTTTESPAGSPTPTPSPPGYP